MKEKEDSFDVNVLPDMSNHDLSFLLYDGQSNRKYAAIKRILDNRLGKGVLNLQSPFIMAKSRPAIETIPQVDNLKLAAGGAGEL